MTVLVINAFAFSAFIGAVFAYNAGVVGQMCCVRGTPRYVFWSNIKHEARPLVVPLAIAHALCRAVIDDASLQSQLFGLGNVFVWLVIISMDKDDDDRWTRRRKRLTSRIRASLTIRKTGPVTS